MFIRNVRRIGLSAALLAASVPGFSQIYSGQYAVILNDVSARFQVPPEIRIGNGLESGDKNHY